MALFEEQMNPISFQNEQGGDVRSFETGDKEKRKTHFTSKEEYLEKKEIDQNRRESQEKKKINRKQRKTIERKKEEQDKNESTKYDDDY